MALKKMTCPHCHGNVHIDLNQNTNTVYCNYCGQLLFLENGHQHKTININKYEHKRYTDDADVIRAHAEADEKKQDTRMVAWILGAAVLIPLIIWLCFSMYGTLSEAQGKVSAGDYQDLIGENYKTVKAHFEAAGFTNIEMIDLDDSWWHDGEVVKISVGGDTEFESFNYFDPDTPVIISYH